MPAADTRLTTLVSILDSLYDSYKDDLPYWLRLPIRFVLKLADKTKPDQLAATRGLTPQDIESAIRQSKLAADKALQAQLATQSLAQLVGSLHKLLSEGLEGLHADVERALFYSWLTLEELREFRQEFRDRLRVPDRLVLVPPRNLPARNPMFVGRESELQDIHRRLSRQPTLGVTQQTAAHGLGGVGKTALAYEYAWRYLSDYPGGVLAIPCDTDRPLWSAVAELALLLNLESPDSERPEDTAVRVKTHLEAGPPALLILDNIRGPEQWADPQWSAGLPGGNCRRLITTRSPHLTAVDMLPVERLPRDQGIALLAQYRPDAADPARAAIVGDVVDWFDGLAVGLTVVGVYMSLHADLRWAAYYQSLQARDLDAVRATEDDVRSAAGGLPDRYARRIDAVFDETLDVLPAEQRRALEYAALLPEDHVLRFWLIWLLEHDRKLKLVPSPGYETQPACPVIDALVERRLLYPLRAEPDTFAVHRVLRRRLAERLSADVKSRRRLLDGVVRLAEARGEASHAALTDRSLRLELTPLLALSGTLRTVRRTKSAASLANWIHTPLSHLGRYADDAASLSGFADDPQQVSVLGALESTALLGNLSNTLRNLGRPDDALQAIQRAIGIQQEHFDPNHPTLATSYSNLAMILRHLGRLDDALQSMQRAIGIEEKHFDPNHPTLATGYSNLAMILQDLGRLDEAFQSTQRAIAILKKNLDPGHPDLATSYSNLAMILRDLGSPDDALQPMQRAIAIQEKHFDPDHPTLATSYNNLAAILADLARHDEAFQSMQRAIAILEKHFDPDHPNLAASYSNLAHIELARGNRDQACTLWHRAHAIDLKRLGPDHPDTRDTAESLRRHCAGLDAGPR